MPADLVVLTPYETRVLNIFRRYYKPGRSFTPIQLEGDRRLPVVAAGLRLVKKGLVLRLKSCAWVLSDAGRAYLDANPLPPKAPT